MQTDERVQLSEPVMNQRRSYADEVKVTLIRTRSVSGRRDLLAMGLAALLMVAPRAFSAPPAAKPNILFIFIDDMGYGDLGCFGGTSGETPAIDRFAREGVRFTQFYVNAPICSPSRVAVTTGQYPSRWNITSYLDKRRMNRERGIADWLRPEAPSLARFLQKAGYYTAHVGKWHMGGQRDVGNAPPISAYGFDASLTNFEGLGERLLPVFERRADGRELRHEPTAMSANLGGPIRWVDRHKVTEGFVDRAVAEMKTASGRSQPFYINLWPDDMHGPVQAPPGLRGNGSPHDQYAGVLTELDRQLGRVFDHIRSDERLRENTLILLASDNGPEPGLGSTGGLRGHKANLYEGGIRSPLIVWGAGVAPAAVGSTNERTVLAGMDLPPSLLAIAGVSAPGVSFDGLDMSEALTGRAQPERRQPIMWVRPPDRPGPDRSWPDLAIRQGKWKLLVDRDGSRPKLFDIGTDPTETTDLAPVHPDITDALSREVRAWAEQVAPRPPRTRTRP